MKWPLASRVIGGRVGEEAGYGGGVGWEGRVGAGVGRHLRGAEGRVGAGGGDGRGGQGRVRPPKQPVCRQILNHLFSHKQ